MTDDQRMRLRNAVEVVREARDARDIVVSSMGSAREWMALGPLHDLDFVFVPSAMGHATSIGLGLALAQPHRRVIVLSGDGSLLMNLGTLVTINAQFPPNLIVIVFVNGVYEVTGAQVTPAAVQGRDDGDSIDYAALARACGISSVFRWSSLVEWRAGVQEVLRARGPTVVILEVQPVRGVGGPRSPGPASERADRFMRALRDG